MVGSEQLLYDLLGYTIFLVGLAIIIIIAFKTIERWKVKVEIDDGRIIRMTNAKEKGRVVKDGRSYVLIEYRDKVSKRVVETLIPEDPDYMRIRSFAGGLVKAIVYRVDGSGNPIAFTKTDNIVVPADKIEFIKTHEMIINALRTKLVLKNIMLYLAIIIIAILIFAGFVIWQASSRPVEVIIQQPNITTTTPAKIPIR